MWGKYGGEKGKNQTNLCSERKGEGKGWGKTGSERDGH